MQHDRRKVLKVIVAAGFTPLVLPGCSWFFSKSKKTASDDSFFVIGKSQSSQSFEVLSYNNSKVVSLKSFPSNFNPQSIVWGTKNKVLISGSNASQVFIFDTKKESLESQNLSGEVTCGPSCYNDKDNSFLTPQQSTSNQSIRLVVRDGETLKEKSEFMLDKCLSVSDLKVHNEDVIVLAPSEDPFKTPAQIMAYSLTDKRLIYPMMINQPFQPSFLEIYDGHYYIGLVRKDQGGESYQAAPLLLFNTKDNTQKFLLSKSSIVNGGMVKSSSATLSSDNKILGICHEEGKQITFWSTEDQSFFGMLRLEVKPQALSSTSTNNEFIVSLENSPAKIVQVSFEKVELKDFGKAPLVEAKSIKKA